MERVHGKEPWDDDELRTRMLAREARAWREFHARFDRLILRCIHRVVVRFPRSLGSEDVRDIYAQFLLSLTARDMHKLRTFSPERGNKLSSWIGMLATHAAWDYVRSSARAPQPTPLSEATSTPTPCATPYEDVLRKQRWSKLSDVLQTFSEKDRTFMRLYYIDGLSPEEVAKEMAISVKTVYSKKHKIQTKLQEVLTPLVVEAA